MGTEIHPEPRRSGSEGKDESGVKKVSAPPPLSSKTGTFNELEDDEIKVYTFKEKVWRFFDDPSSSTGAQVFSLLLMGLITFSVTIFCLESLPYFYIESEVKGSIWDLMEFICVVVFTAEYVLRFLSCPNKLQFLRSFLNAIDLIAIIPFYLENFITFMAGGNSAVFRVVRLVRVFRVFKISRYLSWIRIFMEAMIQSAQPLTMLLFVMMIGCIFFSSAMYFLERGEYDEIQGEFLRPDGSRSPFQSIPETFWWCLVTMTTVGYGDVIPITPLGKLMASITSLTGILVLALPITILSTNFNVEYEKLKKQRKTIRARAMLLKNHFKQKKTGLDAMNMEIEDLVKRASRDFTEEIEELVEVSKEEMILELQQLVLIAYQSRQRDLNNAGVGKKKKT